MFNRKLDRLVALILVRTAGLALKLASPLLLPSNAPQYHNSSVGGNLR